MARVAKDHRECRQEFLDAAHELFYTKGYNETSVNNILQKLDLSKGTFYHSFNFKEELLDELVKHFVEDKPEEDLGIPKFAVIGRPNVGKSSFINALIGREQNIVTEIAGTTRDSLNTILDFVMNFRDTIISTELILMIFRRLNLCLVG